MRYCFNVTKWQRIENPDLWRCCSLGQSVDMRGFDILAALSAFQKCSKSFGDLCLNIRTKYWHWNEPDIFANLFLEMMKWAEQVSEICMRIDHILPATASKTELVHFCSKQLRLSWHLQVVWAHLTRVKLCTTTRSELRLESATLTCPVESARGQPREQRSSRKVAKESRPRMCIDCFVTIRSTRYDISVTKAMTYFAVVRKDFVVKCIPKQVLSSVDDATNERLFPRVVDFATSCNFQLSVANKQLANARWKTRHKKAELW